VRQILHGLAVATPPRLLVRDEAIEILDQAFEFERIVVAEPMPPAFFQFADLQGHPAQRSQTPAHGEKLGQHEQQGHGAEPDVKAPAEVLDRGLERRPLGRHVKGEYGILEVFPDHRIAQMQKRLACRAIGRAPVRVEVELTGREGHAVTLDATRPLRSRNAIGVAATGMVTVQVRRARELRGRQRQARRRLPEHPVVAVGDPGIEPAHGLRQARLGQGLRNHEVGLAALEHTHEGVGDEPQLLFRTGQHAGPERPLEDRTGQREERAQQQRGQDQ
jgi:hypothetical protein